MWPKYFAYSCLVCQEVTGKKWEKFASMWPSLLPRVGRFAKEWRARSGENLPACDPVCCPRLVGIQFLTRARSGEGGLPPCDSICCPELVGFPRSDRQDVVKICQLVAYSWSVCQGVTGKKWGKFTSMPPSLLPRVVWFTNLTLPGCPIYQHVTQFVAQGWLVCQGVTGKKWGRKIASRLHCTVCSTASLHFDFSDWSLFFYGLWWLQNGVSICFYIWN